MNIAAGKINSAGKDFAFRERHARDLETDIKMLVAMTQRHRAFQGETPPEKRQAAIRLQGMLGGAIKAMELLTSADVPPLPTVDGNNIVSMSPPRISDIQDLVERINRSEQTLCAPDSPGLLHWPRFKPLLLSLAIGAGALLAWAL